MYVCKLHSCVCNSGLHALGMHQTHTLTHTHMYIYIYFFIIQRVKARAIP